MKPVVVIKDLWVHYNHVWALREVNLVCEENSITSIVGPNGGGKTTLLKAVLGLKRPDRGSVEVFGEKPGALKRPWEMGYLPQLMHVERNYPVSALDVVCFGLYKKLGIFRRPGKKEKTAALNALALVGMEEHVNEHFGSLSGGQQQRVSIARAMVGKPRLLVMDEPSTGIDIIAQEDFYELLVRLKKEDGISIIMVSHDIGVVTSYVDQVACLNHRLHFHGSPMEIDDSVLKDTFGSAFHVILHDQNCATCRLKDHDEL